ncbi:leucyl aminopeptidase [Demequina sp.]|uniref:leucyl aminopeptidase n=1 Tax=Demequina sp. TaxID=2050685 RepID=UPI003D1051B9
MTSARALSDALDTFAADALIVGLTGDGEVASHPQLPDAARAALEASLGALDASGKLGSVTVVPGGEAVSARRVVGVGIGSGSANDLREAAGSASRSVGKKATSVAVALPIGDDGDATAVVHGVLLGSYSFTAYKSDHEAHDTEWHIAGASDTAIERGSIVAEAVNGSRDLVNTPPLDMYPAALADAALALGAEHGISVTVWDEDELAEMGCGGILGVGLGSSRPPRLVRVAYTPADSKGTVALVGKGITFDTGGISLKPSKSMETMKSDMSGAAIVLHTVVAAARLGLGVGVTGWLCIAENMPSATAQRPSDVIRIYGGKTVEVLNTDAEGRLVMADGLVKAIEESPDAVLDVATLTGAQGMALGTRTSGVMGDDAVRDEVIAAANAAGEPMWPMPLPEHLRESIVSKVADLQNIGDPNGGGMLSAGLFLKEFVGDTPWAHLDIARPAFNEGSAHDYAPPGATGASLRTLLRFLAARADA